MHPCVLALINLTLSDRLNSALPLFFKPLLLYSDIANRIVKVHEKIQLYKNKIKDISGIKSDHDSKPTLFQISKSNNNTSGVHISGRTVAYATVVSSARVSF